MKANHCAIFLSVFILAGSANARGPEATRILEVISDETALATFQSFDNSDTLETDVSLQASNFIDKQTGQPIFVSDQTNLSVNIIDIAHPDDPLAVKLAASGVSTSQCLSIDKDLDRAHLVADVILLDSNGTNFPAHIDVTWSLQKGSDLQHITDTSIPNTVTNNWFRATHASGVISIGESSAYPAIANVVPEPALTADGDTNLGRLRSITKSAKAVIK